MAFDEKHWEIFERKKTHFCCWGGKPATLIGYRRDSFLELCFFICFPIRISIISFKNAYWDLKRCFKHMAISELKSFFLKKRSRREIVLILWLAQYSDFRFLLLEIADWEQSRELEFFGTWLNLHSNFNKIFIWPWSKVFL